jgi:hypothetical protein
MESLKGIHRTLQADAGVLLCNTRLARQRFARVCARGHCENQQVRVTIYYAQHMEVTEAVFPYSSKNLNVINYFI